METPAFTFQRCLALAISAAVLAAAGCGGGIEPAAQPESKKPAAPTAAKAPERMECGGGHGLSAKQRRERSQIERDLRAIRRARTHAQTSEATDRFMLHVATSSLPALVRSRMIDHAAAAAVAKCEDCFMALEASRPVAGSLKCQH